MSPESYATHLHLPGSAGRPRPRSTARPTGRSSVEDARRGVLSSPAFLRPLSSPSTKRGRGHRAGGRSTSSGGNFGLPREARDRVRSRPAESRQLPALGYGHDGYEPTLTPEWQRTPWPRSPSAERVRQGEDLATNRCETTGLRPRCRPHQERTRKRRRSLPLRSRQKARVSPAV